MISKRNTETVYLSHLKMIWNPPPPPKKKKKIKILGLWFTNDLTRMTEPTVADTFNQIVKVVNMLSERIKSPLRRVAMLRSFIFGYCYQIPPDVFTKRLQMMCLEFILYEREGERERARNNCS